MQITTLLRINHVWLKSLVLLTILCSFTIVFSSNNRSLCAQCNPVQQNCVLLSPSNMGDISNSNVRWADAPKQRWQLRMKSKAVFKFCIGSATQGHRCALRMCDKSSCLEATTWLFSIPKCIFSCKRSSQQRHPKLYRRHLTSLFITCLSGFGASVSRFHDNDLELAYLRLLTLAVFAARPNKLK